MMSKFVFIPRKWVLLALDYNLVAQAEFISDYWKIRSVLFGRPVCYRLSAEKSVIVYLRKMCY